MRLLQTLRAGSPDVSACWYKKSEVEPAVSPAVLAHLFDLDSLDAVAALECFARD